MKYLGYLIVFGCGFGLCSNLSRLVETNNADFEAAWWRVIMILLIAVVSVLIDTCAKQVCKEREDSEDLFKSRIWNNRDKRGVEGS